MNYSIRGGLRGCHFFHQSSCGFTLIEMATVIAIMGLMIVSVLNGYELVLSAKVKKLSQEFRDVQIMVYGYQDKYRYLPGDDPRANTRFVGGQLATDVIAIGNGEIDGHWNSNDLGDESALAWQHLRLSGLASGAISFSNGADMALYFPKNPDGGRIGLQSLMSFSSRGITDGNLTGTMVICSDRIAGKVARLLDIALDDGETHSGTMRAIPSGSMPGLSTETSQLDNTAMYTVCLTF
jgi:prepilin-type N-terminal cleavage/methylation domain-containing protein